MEKKKKPKEYRSRKAIKNAFITLLETQPYQTITIQNIIDKSEYSKGTFYAHFTDKSDLTQQLIQDEVDICVACNTSYISKVKIDAPTNELRKHVNPGTLAYFEHVYKHQSLYRLIVEDKIPGESLSKMADMNAKQYLKVFQPGSLMPPYDKLNWELFNYQTSHIYMQYIAYWVEHNFNFSPKYMAEQAYLLMRTDIPYAIKAEPTK